MKLFHSKDDPARVSGQMDFLDAYAAAPAFTGCSLDARYFNGLFFDKIPNLFTSSLDLTIYNDGNVSVSMASTGRLARESQGYNQRFRGGQTSLGIIRVVINTPTGRHCNILLIEPDKKLITRFEPYLREVAPYDQQINQGVKKLLAENFPGWSYEVVHGGIPLQADATPTCTETGLCVAYGIKFVYDYLNNRPLDLSNIRQFAGRVVAYYTAMNGQLDPFNPDEEYGFFDTPWPLVGGLGGAAVGGLVGGVPGALVGGLAGGTIGYLASQPSYPTYYTTYPTYAATPTYVTPTYTTSYVTPYYL